MTYFMWSMRIIATMAFLLVLYSTLRVAVPWRDVVGLGLIAIGMWVQEL